MDGHLARFFKRVRKSIKGKKEILSRGKQYRKNRMQETYFQLRMKMLKRNERFAFLLGRWERRMEMRTRMRMRSVEGKGCCGGCDKLENVDIPVRVEREVEVQQKKQKRQKPKRTPLERNMPEDSLSSDTSSSDSSSLVASPPEPLLSNSLSSGSSSADSESNEGSTIKGSRHVFLSKTKHWDIEALKEGISKVCFGPGFNVKDSHLLAIANAPKDFRARLTSFACGNSDSGYGSSLSHAAVATLAKACPALLNITFESSCDLTDATIYVLLKHCPNLHSISISGNNKVTGKITGAIFRKLDKNPGLGKGLKSLGLVDQDLDLKELNALLKTRRRLDIIEGRTMGNGAAARVVASLTGTSTGGNPVRKWRGGKIVNVGFRPE